MTYPTEADLQRAILLAIGARHGVYVARTSSVACYLPDGRGGYRLHRPLPAGWPDITAVVFGRILGVEVKAPRLRRQDGSAPLRASQEVVRAAWVAAGGAWVTATTVAEVLATVAAIEQGVRDGGA